MTEKAYLILGMKDEIRRTSEHFNKVTEMQAMGKREAEMLYKQELYAMQEEFDLRKNNMVEQYEHLIKLKDEEIFKFGDECQKYIGDKK
jgi:hypothetical protein